MESKSVGVTFVKGESFFLQEEKPAKITAIIA